MDTGENHGLLVLTEFEQRTFRELHTLLTEGMVDPKNKAVFCKALALCMNIAEIRQGDIGREFEMTPNAINRWKWGKSAPSPVVRKYVFQYLAERVRQKLV